MRVLIEIFMMQVLSLFAYYSYFNTEDIVLFFVLSTILSISIFLIEDKKLKSLPMILFMILGYFYHPIIVFYPAALYSLFYFYKEKSLLSSILLIVDFKFYVVILCGVSIYLSFHNEKFKKSISALSKENDYLNLNYDKMTKDKINVINKTDEKIKEEILKERERISRRLHDVLGHTISSSIIHIKSLIITTTDENTKKELTLLNEKLKEGMKEIRENIYDIKSESFNLKKAVESLYKDIPMDLTLDYNIIVNNSSMKEDLFQIIKEALTNTIKHSDASKVHIMLSENDTYYILKIKDDGRSEAFHIIEGIGFDNMRNVSKKYNGNFNYFYKDGMNINIYFRK